MTRFSTKSGFLWSGGAVGTNHILSCGNSMCRYVPAAPPRCI